MKKNSNEQLIQKAKEVAQIHKSSEQVIIGEVGCALLSQKGDLYLGVSIQACCGIGFCAEHSAIANMFLNQEYRIKRIVAVCADGTILPPCGRCREFMYEVDQKNNDTEIVLEKNRVVKLKDLLPEPWQNKFKE